MFFLILSFAIVAIPYGLERLYFSRKFGLFAALFWLFIFQFSVLFGGEVIAANQMGQSLPMWIKSVGLAIGVFAYLTIGMTPIAAILAAVIIGAVIAAESFLKKSRDSSN